MKKTQIGMLLLALSLLAASASSAQVANGSVRITAGAGGALAGVQASGSTATSVSGLASMVAKQGTAAPGAGNFGWLGLDASGNLSVNCIAGCSAAATFTDNTAWTAGTTTLTNVGGVFNDSATALTSGNAGTFRLTTNRALHTNLRNASGTEIGIAATPIRTDPTGTTIQPVNGTVSANATLGTGLGAFASAQQAVTAAAVALGTNTVKTACVRSLGTSTQAVYIGATGVTTGTGYELSPGDSQCWPVSNTNLLFVVAPSTGATVSYDWVN